MRFVIMPSTPTYVHDQAMIEQTIRRCQDSKLLGVDTETLGKKYTNMTDQIVVLGLSPDDESRYMIPRKYLQHFKCILEDETIPKALTNIKFDAHRFANAGISLKGAWADTVVLDFLLDEDTRENKHGLKPCAQDYLGLPMAEYKELFGNDDISQIQPGHPKWKQFLDYSTLDPWASRKVAIYLLEKLAEIRLWHDREITLADHYWEVEEPQLKCLYAMERRGVRVDAQHLISVGQRLEVEMNDIAAKLNAAVGRPINPDSPQQIGAYLFDTIGLSPMGYTDTGRPKTDQNTLSYFAKKGVEECALVLAYKKASKMKGTYCKGLLKLIHTDGKVHTTYSPTKVTGRLGSQKPNLQNVPRPDWDRHNIREAFIPDEGHVFIVADYSQLEMRVLAEAASEHSMIEAIRNGLDMHCFTASMMFDTSYEEMYQKAKVEGDPAWGAKRSAAKAIGFGLVYGKTAYGLSADLKISREEAEEFIEKFFNAFPGVRTYITSYIKAAKRFGYVQTIQGRFRRLSKIGSPNPRVRAHAERQAINAPIQGSAADIVKNAMIKISVDGELEHLGFRLLMQVHDELIGQCPKETAQECAEIIKHYMENPFLDPLSVPLVTEPKIVSNWKEGK